MTATIVEAPQGDYLDPHHLYAAFGAAQARYWIRRAETFERARPTRDDFHGNATPADLRAQWQRLTVKARACRARAEIASRYRATPVDRALILAEASSLAVAA